ncbi:MAG: ABC transporter permease [Janthinobacterium lividum]
MLASPEDVAPTRGRRLQHPLLRYVLARLGISVLLVWGVTLVTFVLTSLVPADPVAAVLGDQAAGDPEVVAQFRRELGLDRSLPVQYLLYLQRLLHANLGTSAQTRQPVLDDLRDAVPATVELALFVLVVSVLIGVGAGILAALRHRRPVDEVIRVLSLVGISTPTFWLALIVFYVGFYRLGWFPGSGRLDARLSPPPEVTGFMTIDSLLAGNTTAFVNALGHLLLPGLVLTLYAVGLLARFSRTAVLDVLSSEFVVAARAKGLPARTVVFRYVLRGALLPILTVIGLSFGSLLSGSVLTETVFAWHGLGQYAYQAATRLDLQAVMGVGIVVGVTYIAINFVVDMLYAVVDPRVRRS